MKATCVSVLSLLVFPAVAAAQEGFASPAAGKLEVVTQNVYVGADILRVLAGDPADVPFLVAETLAIIVGTDFPTRAERLAELIGQQRPDLVGLQEVSLIRTQSPGDFLMGNPQSAETVLFDYLDILMAALSERGLDYRVASLIQNADVELPSFAGIGPGGPMFDDVRLTDRDVILAHASVLTGNEVSNHYTMNLAFDVGGVQVDFLRGYTSVEAVVRGRHFRVVDTHLELNGDGGLSFFQSAQASELIGTFAAEPLPLVVLGDFNSDPGDPVGAFVPPYAQLAAAGFLDTATAVPGSLADEPTCCQDETLDNPTSSLYERIDQIWMRSSAPIGPVQSYLFGEDPSDRIDGLWASDHCGVFARLHAKLPR